jgi:hypothetical protein
MEHKTRAAKGGEYGLNGQFYNGGEFLPSSAFTAKGEFSSNRKSQPWKPSKKEVAPYKWEVQPAEGAQSIYGIIAGVFGKVIDGKFQINTNEKTLNYFHKTIEEVEELSARWNNGERWI